MNILPFIVMFLMAFMSQYIKIHGGIFLLIILWIIFGAIYTIYLRAWKWNVVQYNINTSFDINPNNCGFEK
jgi:threonine/homoserine/homoserine lactone efflux protein